MRAIALSDTHLGWDQSEALAFRQFLTDLPDIDHLILLGDIFDMWRRDMAGVLIENRDVLDQLARLHARGINVVLIYGNHDLHLGHMGTTRSYPPPFTFLPEWRLPTSDFTYLFRHGHQYDPTTQNTQEDEALCHTNDDEGARLSGAYANPATRIRYANPLNHFKDPDTPYIPTWNALRYRRLANPGLRDEPILLDIVRKRARATQPPNTFLIHGHTHVPMTDDAYADTGCWVRGRRDYIELHDTTATLRTYA